MSWAEVSLRILLMPPGQEVGQMRQAAQRQEEEKLTRSL